MRRIRSKNTRAEVALRSWLHKRGFRFRVNFKELPGKPDIVFTRRRLAVFVHGCFWHQHPGCKQASTPRTNLSYWAPKLFKNVMRDTAHSAALKRLNYATIVLWECDIERDLAAAGESIVTALNQCQRNV